MLWPFTLPFNVNLEELPVLVWKLERGTWNLEL